MFVRYHFLILVLTHFPSAAPYHYVPTESIVVLFIVLYGISTLLHIGQAWYYRLWWLLPTAAFAGALEVAGWSGRLWSHFNVPSISPFQMQITATILAPTPLLAANFVILGRIINQIGPSYTRLRPKWYTIIFCVCDVISLTVQGVGGGLASSEAANGGDARLGGNVMLGGIVFQLVTIIVFSICATEFFIRVVRDLPIRRHNLHTRGYLDGRGKAMVAALAFNTTCLFIRSVYRTIELSDGWSGRIISTQVYFNVLDGGMVTLAIYTLNIAHPGFLLFRDESMQKSERSSDDVISEAKRSLTPPGQAAGTV
jgi:hypothetical protein